MERKNDSTILLLVAAGLGIYWFMKNKSLPPATTSVVVPTTTPISEAVVSTQPVYNTPVIEIPVYEVPVDQTVISTQPVYEQPVQSAVSVEYTPVMDMFNSISTGGGLTNNQIETINNIPQSALSDKYL